MVDKKEIAKEKRNVMKKKRNGINKGLEKKMNKKGKKKKE